MNSAKKQPQSKTGFRPGPRGACEAHLFAFTRFAPDDDSEQEPPRLIAAVSLIEAVMFLKHDTPDYRIRTAEDRGLIVMLSGSPFS